MAQIRRAGDLVAPGAGSDRQAAWDALVERHADLVVKVAGGYRLPTSEVAAVSQTVWLRLADALDTLPDSTDRVGWLVAATRAECLRIIRAHRREPARDARVSVPAQRARGSHASSGRSAAHVVPIGA